MGITGIITLVVAAGVLIGLIKDVVTSAKKLTEKNNVQTLPAGYINHEQAQILKDKPRAGYDTAPLGVEKSKTSQNMALGLGKVATGVVAGLAGFAGGAQVAALAKKGMKIAQKGVGIANNKLGVTRKINGVAWLAKGMKYKVADKVSLAKNTIANSKLGKGASKVIRGVKKATKPNVDALKAGLTLAASGVTGRTYKAQKEEFAKIKRLEEQARINDRKRSEIEKYEYKQANKKIRDERRKIINRYARLDKSRNRMMQKLADKGDMDGVDNLEASIYKAEKNRQKELREVRNNIIDSYNARIENALKSANLRGYSKGNSGFTKIGAAITTGGAATAGYIAGKLTGRKGTANSAMMPVIHNTTQQVIQQNQFDMYDLAAELAGPIVLHASVKDTIKISELSDGLKAARSKNLTSKQAVQYSNLKGKAEYFRAQQIENGVKKPLDVGEISNYFVSAIKQNSNMSTDEMFKSIQEAVKIKGTVDVKYGNTARKLAENSAAAKQLAKDTLKHILEESSEAREMIDRLTKENEKYALSEEELEKLEQQARDTGKSLEEIKIDTTIDKFSKDTLSEIINSSESETARRVLNENYDKYKMGLENGFESIYKEKLEKLKKIADSEFLKANRQIHPEYANLPPDKLRLVREESDIDKHVKEGMKKVQKEIKNEVFSISSDEL